MTLDYRLVVAISCVALAFLALAGFILVVAVAPALPQRRALRTRARQDFLDARGTAHRQLLIEALRRTEAASAACSDNLAKTRNLKLAAESHLKDDLDLAASRHIVANHLHEIGGIGAKLQHELINSIFKGRLSDLHGADQLPGIGKQRQAAISAWVTRYEVTQATLIRDGFPGHEEIRGKYQEDIRSYEARIQDLMAEQATLSERTKLIKEQLARLDGVTEKDFLAALRHPGRRSDKLAVYTGGVFEEWEPVPVWFRELLEA